MDSEQESRRTKRDSVFRVATIFLPGSSEPVTGRARDVSDDGARIERIDGVHPGMEIRVAIGTGSAVAATVAWASDGQCGIVFDRCKPPAPEVQRSTVDAVPKAGWIADLRDGYRR
jgi:hypothetical protein